MGSTKWEQTIINIGRVKENSKVIFSFNSKEDLEIKSVKPGCGSCTYINGYNKNSINVTYKSGSFPIHFKRDGKKSYKFSKVIIVTYKDGTADRLHFNGEVYR